MRSAARVVGPDVLRQVRRIELRTRRLVTSLFSGDYRSVFRGQGMEFAEVRAYEHGDDYRAIDWNVSARMGSPYVKTFEEERELTLLLVVDRSGSVEFGAPRSKAAVAVEVAAVLALAAARHHDRVGALLFTDEVESVIRPAKGRRHALRVIRDLLVREPEGRGTNLAQALVYAQRLLHHRAIVVVLSDFRASDWERPLARLARRHDVVAVTVEDPRERLLPEVGWVELDDAEGRGRVLVDTTDRRMRTRIQMASESARLKRERALSKVAVDHVSLSTDAPYEHALHRAFVKRARRISR